MTHETGNIAVGVCTYPDCICIRRRYSVMEVIVLCQSKAKVIHSRDEVETSDTAVPRYEDQTAGHYVAPQPDRFGEQEHEAKSCTAVQPQAIDNTGQSDQSLELDKGVSVMSEAIDEAMEEAMSIEDMVVNSFRRARARLEMSDELHGHVGHVTLQFTGTFSLHRPSIQMRFDTTVRHGLHFVNASTLAAAETEFLRRVRFHSENKVRR